MNSIENKTQSAVRKDEIASPKVAAHQPVDDIRERRRRRGRATNKRKGRVYRR
jgi:cell division protein FtsA